VEQAEADTEAAPLTLVCAVSAPLPEAVNDEIGDAEGDPLTV
jgi:hypothetical protein